MTIRYTRSTNYRPFSARGLVDELRTLEVPLPEAVTTARDLIDALKARAKATPADKDHRHAVIEALLADPDVDIDQLIAAEVDADTRHNVLLQAQDSAQSALSQTIATHSDELTRALRSTVFEPALATLTTVAATTTAEDTATSLLRAGNAATAKALVAVPEAALAVAACYRLRDRIYAGSGLRNLACAIWRNPDELDALRHSEDLGVRYLAGLRLGGVLWLGTYAEVDDTTRQLAPTPAASPPPSPAVAAKPRLRKKATAEDAIARAGLQVQEDLEPQDAA